MRRWYAWSRDGRIIAEGSTRTLNDVIRKLIGMDKLHEAHRVSVGLREYTMSQLYSA